MRCNITRFLRRTTAFAATAMIIGVGGLALPQTISAGVTLAERFAPASASSDAANVGLPGEKSREHSRSQFTANPASVSFGSVAVGSDGLQSITLTNSGTASITISSAEASGTGFAIAGLSTPMSVGAGQSVRFSASFTPTSAGNASGNISIASDAPGSPMLIALSGTGAQAQIAIVPSSAVFGSVVIGNSNSQTVTVSNSGTANLTISQAATTGAGFSTAGLNSPLTIAAGNRAAFNVVFAPSSSGGAAGSLTLLSNAANSPLAIPLTGTGLAASALLGASSTSLSFGSVNDGTTNSLNVTLTNSGNANVTISGVNATGAGFTASGVIAGTTLAPNQTATLSVAFDPATPGAATGALTVTSNATNSPATISLSGTGVTPASVALSWTPSSSSDVVGYNEYRGTALGTYSKINSSPISGTTYADTTVQSGQDITYYYVVTAVNSNGLESADSSPASVTVP
jgi:hypothetical protein